MSGGALGRGPTTATKYRRERTTALDRIEAAALDAGLAGCLEWWRVAAILRFIFARAALDDWCWATARGWTP